MPPSFPRSTAWGVWPTSEGRGILHRGEAVTPVLCCHFPPVCPPEAEVVSKGKRPDCCSGCYPSRPHTALATQLVTKGHCGVATDHGSRKGTPYHSHRQIELTPEKPQMVPPGPKRQKVLFFPLHLRQPVAFSKPQDSPSFVNPLPRGCRQRPGAKGTAATPAAENKMPFVSQTPKKGWIYF